MWLVGVGWGQHLEKEPGAWGLGGALTDARPGESSAESREDVGEEQGHPENLAPEV